MLVERSRARAGWRRVWAVAAACLLLPAVSLHGQKPDVCDALPKVSVPEKDKPTLAEVRSLGVQVVAGKYKACFGSDLYYGAGPDRFRKARWCVLAKLGMFAAGSDPAQAKGLQGIAAGGATDPEDIYQVEGLVLAMMYANGEGVPRNLPLAKQFLCQYGGGIQSATDEELLADFDKTIAAKKRFDVCEDDGGAQGRSVSFFCLGMKGGKLEDEAHRLEASIAAAGGPAEKAPFAALVRTWNDFHTAYNAMAEAECAGGTGCGVISEGDDVQALQTWLDALKQIQQNKPPAEGASAAEFAKVDKDLNQIYQEQLKDMGDCTQQGDCPAPLIRAADRAWLQYREAWVTFGKLRWPGVPADQWRAWQTKQWMALLTTE